MTEPRAHPDLTTTGRINPTKVITDNFQMLMSIRDVHELVAKAKELVQPCVGHGMSEANWTKFVKTLDKEKHKGLVRVQFYLSNYILTGMGHGLAAVEPERRRDMKEDTEIYACFLDEDPDSSVGFTYEQLEIKKLIESLTDLIVVPIR